MSRRRAIPLVAGLTMAVAQLGAPPARAEPPAAPAGCGTTQDPQDQWVGSVTWAATTITVAIADDAIPFDAERDFQICTSDGVVTDLRAPGGAQGGTTHTITRLGSADDAPELSPNTDYWVRFVDSSGTGISWHHIRTLSDAATFSRADEDEATPPPPPPGSPGRPGAAFSRAEENETTPAITFSESPHGSSVPVSSASFERELTLAECILLAVRNNRDLATGRLDRLAQKLSLEDSEDAFRPAPAFDVSLEHDSRSSPLDREEVSSFGVAPRVTLRIPTGGAFNLSTNSRVTSQDNAEQSVRLEFVQPLLKGSGVAVGTADIVTARRTERIGLLAFKSAVIGLVTRAVYAYRAVIQSMREVEIRKRSLQRARDLLAVNRILIETGRMAEQEIVQTEADVAERELSLTEARDSLNDARVALIDILDIDSRTRIRPTEALRVDSREFHADRAVESALQHRPDYRRALLSIENAETALLVADDARKWELDLVSSASLGHSGRSLSEAYGRLDDDYRVGLRLNIPLGANAGAAGRNHERAMISLRQSRIRLAELRQSIDVEVRGAVRDVRVRFRRIELARQARGLAERKLEIERIKLNSGLSTNFRLVRFEDDLVRSQNNEIGAVIGYLNALTELDRARGTTLDTWRIDIDLPVDGAAEE